MLSSNEIKEIASLKQKKYRNEYGKFLIEGFHLVEECLNSEFELEYIILREGTDLQGKAAILEKISKNKTIVEPLPEKQFNKLVETEASQGIIGIVKKPAKSKDGVNGKLIIALDRISDPGNMGTIIRTAWWFGVNEIWLSEECADPYNSKVIRSTQGGIFHLNIREDLDLKSALDSTVNNGYKAYLFTLDAEKMLYDITENDKAILVFGNEAHGISDEIQSGGFDKVKINGFSDCESLNAAISAGIALYHFTK